MARHTMTLNLLRSSAAQIYIMQVFIRFKKVRAEFNAIWENVFFFSLYVDFQLKVYKYLC